MFSKMVGFQVFNTVVASSVYYFFEGDALTPVGRRHSWYVYGSGMVLNVLIGDTFIINLGIDLLQPGLLYARHVAAPAAHTQREMNQILSPKADIYLAFRLQLVTKLVVITLIYSSALPLCTLLTAAFMWLAMWVDRYNLLRRFAPPPRSPDFLISVVHCYIMPAAIAVHLGCTVLFFEQQRRVVHADPLCSSIAALTEYEEMHSAGELVGPNPVFSFGGVGKYAAAGATGEGGGGATTGVGVCQTAATIAQADAAVTTCWIALAIWGTALAYYVWRELTRKADAYVHATADNLLARFVDVFTVQQPVQRQARWKRGRTSHRTRDTRRRARSPNHSLGWRSPPAPAMTGARRGTPQPFPPRRRRLAVHATTPALGAREPWLRRVRRGGRHLQPLHLHPSLYEGRAIAWAAPAAARAQPREAEGGL